MAITAQDKEKQEPIEAVLDPPIRYIDRSRAYYGCLAMETPIAGHEARTKEAAADGRIGELNDRFYGVPTLRSQRLTMEREAPQVLEMCRQDGIEVAVLVAT